MKKFINLTVLILALTSAVLAQEPSKTVETKQHTQTEEKSQTKTSPTDKNMKKIDEPKPFEYDNESVADANGVLKRGAGIGTAKKVSLAKAMKNPKEFDGKMVLVEGVIVRSCKMEGCWMELAPSKEAKSVRVTFKNHAFFIPLDAAGMSARAEGVFTVKTLSKEEVDHLINEDGAKFDNINKDGTVTEVSFEATGVELKKS
jgi:hypothetical protein